MPGLRYPLPDHQEAQLTALASEAPGTGAICRLPELDDVDGSTVKPAGVGISALSLTPVSGADGPGRGDDPRAAGPWEPSPGEQAVAAKASMAAVRTTARLSQVTQRPFIIVD
jgi:hypothetical protein